MAMMFRRLLLISCLSVATLVFGCSGGDSSIAPIDTENAADEADTSEAEDDVSASEAEDVSSDVEESEEELTCWAGIQICEGAGVKTCVDGIWGEVVPCASGTCVDGYCEDCDPDCDGRVCGPDGCGGLCGECPDGGACDAGQCAGCVPECGEAECGPNGCGGSCGQCDVGLACADGKCDCVPQCDGKECGPNGCGGQCGMCLGDFTCSESNECVPEAYRVVLVQDHWNSSSGCSSYNSSGADIDAVSLYGADGELISYFAEVIEEVGTEQCTNSYTDPESAVGPTDGTDNGCIALQGGWIMGRFVDYVAIEPGMKVVVHEFGQQQGGSSEPFSVYLATGFDCAESEDPGACSILISDEGYGATEFTIPE